MLIAFHDFSQQFFTAIGIARTKTTFNSVHKIRNHLKAHNKTAQPNSFKQTNKNISQSIGKKY